MINTNSIQTLLHQWLADVQILEMTPGQKFNRLLKAHGHDYVTLVEAMKPVHCTDQAISNFVVGRSKRHAQNGLAQN